MTFIYIIFHLGKTKETIGTGVDEFNQEINENWLGRKREPKDKSKQRELMLIEEEAAKVESTIRERRNPQPNWSMKKSARRTGGY